MLFDIGIYRLEIDIQKTKHYYNTTEYIGCECMGCQNYEKAASQLPHDVRSFLQQFGIAAEKPARVSALHSPDGTEVLYEGSYHICGSILQGTNPWVRTGKKQFHLDERYSIPLSNGFSFFFCEDCYLLEDDFPMPAIQLTFSGTLPWVLEMPNPYT